MSTSLDSLSATRSELTSEQMRVADGGILLFVVIYAVAYMHGYQDGLNS